MKKMASLIAILMGINFVSSKAFARASTSNDEVREIASEAYMYFYSLISMIVTRDVLTNTPAGHGYGGPMNTIVNIRAFPGANDRGVVRPNFDTLYSSAFIDLSSGPMILQTGDTKGRYFLLPLLDAWSNVFAVPGKRTSGTGAQTYALVTPDWKGSLPSGVQVIVAPTSFVWMIGRTQTNGPSDYEFVHQIQDNYKVMTLSEYTSGKVKPISAKIDPSIDTKTPPLDQVNRMSAADYFKLASEAIKQNPPQMTDWSILERMKKIGFVVGQTYNLNAQPADVQTAVAQGAKEALAEMARKLPTLAKVVNGWQMNTDTMGVYGNYYLKRAIVAMVGLGANPPEDAIYPMAVADANGQPIDGANNYVLHFEKSELPPVGAFWSITMYDAQGFQVPNVLNRFAIGDRDNLKYNTDGSLDIYFQSKDPGGDKTSNWLPSPASGTLGITMRLYAPAPEALNGVWNPPAIVKK